MKQPHPLTLPSDVLYRLVEYGDDRSEVWEAALSDEERARAAAFKAEKRRREFTLGRAAARLLLAERLAVAPPEVPLVVAPDGAVDVVDTSYHLSITHRGRHAAAVVAERAVGIDLEYIAVRRPGLHRFIFHPDDYALFDGLPLDEARALILAWTLKEAVLKAQRVGLRLSPRKLRLEIDWTEQAAVVQVEDGRRWQVRFADGGGYYLAVAYAP